MLREDVALNVTFVNGSVMILITLGEALRIKQFLTLVEQRLTLSSGGRWWLREWAHG